MAVDGRTCRQKESVGRLRILRKKETEGTHVTGLSQWRVWWIYVQSWWNDSVRFLKL